MKKKLLITSLIISAALGISTSFAAEEIVYYDDTNLDAIFDKYPEYKKTTGKSNEVIAEKQIGDSPSTENEGQKEEIYHYNKDGTLAKGLTDFGDVRRYFDKETGQMIKNKTYTNENIHVDENG